MCDFRVGQRIKKVRGKEGIGITGVVLGFEERIDPAFPMVVSCDRPWKARSGRVKPASMPARCIPAHWEPLTPSGAAPSEHTFHQLMDLLTAGEVANV